MIIVDTSVWIDHLRHGSDRLRELLLANEVLCHPFVIGELACGNMRKRDEVLTHLKNLPVTGTVTHEEALSFVESHRLAGSGIGWVDVHVLAAARLVGARVWTLDRRLRRVALAMDAAEAVH